MREKMGLGAYLVLCDELGEEEVEIVVSGIVAKIGVSGFRMAKAFDWAREREGIKMG